LNARVRIGSSEVSVDLASGVSLAVEVDFSGAGPRHFGAPAASSEPFAVPGFSGSVATGASCNCRTITLIPHCNGTHTECVGHLTHEQVDAHRVIPLGLIPAILVSVRPEHAEETRESTEPAPQSGDQLITRRALESSWPESSLRVHPRAIVIRTSPRDRNPHSTGEPPPYLSHEAVRLLVERGIEHLVVDVPSIDRTHDEGRLTAHRTFFGLPPRASRLAQAQRPHCTITELANVPNHITDGWYLLEIQAPALGGDAVPSRPLLYPVLTS
jgi:kynurenine formamidase